MRPSDPPEPRPGGIRLQLSIGVVCSLGLGSARGGRESNQDNYLVSSGNRVCWREGDAEAVTLVPARTEALFAVADGMGGHEDGDIASASAVQALSRLFLRPAPPDPEGVLREFMVESHRRIHDRVAERGEVKMGTTLTVAWILGDTAWWGHVGDSRLYHWRAGRLSRITRDQTREEFAVRDGRPVPSHPRYLAQSFIYGSRGLGDDAGIRVDRGLDTGRVGLLPGDRLVFTTDGLHSVVDDFGIADCVLNVPEPMPCAVALVERAMARDSDDNITALVVRVDRADRPGPNPDDNTIIPV